MKYFKKVSFEEMTDKQKIYALTQIISDLFGQGYMQIEIDKHWRFEVFDDEYLSYANRPELQERVVVENIGRSNSRKNLMA